MLDYVLVKMILSCHILDKCRGDFVEEESKSGEREVGLQFNLGYRWYCGFGEPALSREFCTLFQTVLLCNLTANMFRTQ